MARLQDVCLNPSLLLSSLNALKCGLDGTKVMLPLYFNEISAFGRGYMTLGLACIRSGIEVSFLLYRYLQMTAQLDHISLFVF
jgi:hypothetical protein